MALYWVIKNNCEVIIRLLLDKGLEVDIQDKNGKTMLYWAAKNGHEATVKLWFDKEVEADIQNSNK